MIINEDSTRTIDLILKYKIVIYLANVFKLFYGYVSVCGIYSIVLYALLFKGHAQTFSYVLLNSEFGQCLQNITNPECFLFSPCQTVEAIKLIKLFLNLVVQVSGLYDILPTEHDDHITSIDEVWRSGMV